MKTALCIVGLVLLAACGPQTITDQPDRPGNGGQQEKMASVGDAITLEGNEDGLQMGITVMEVVDPATSPNEFVAPGAGNRFVAVRMRLDNVGSLVYSDSPSNGAVLIDRDDQAYDSSLAGIEPDLGAPKISPGDARVGFITFEVPKRAKLATFQFTLDSGFGPQTGEWSLR